MQKAGRPHLEPAAREAAMHRLETIASAVRTPSGDAFFDVRTFREPERTIADAEPWQADVMAPQLPAHGFVFVSVVPDVLERLWPDGEVRIDGVPVPVGRLVAAHDFTGDHDPTAFFLAAGPAVARGLPRGRLSVLDVAPLVLYLAGQPLPDDLDGRLPEELLDPAWLARRPVRVMASSEVPRLPADEELDPDAAESEEIRERLRALGYLQ